MKFVRMLILALGLMAIATASSFATVAFSTSSTVNIMAVNAQTAPAGSILFTPIAPGTVNSGEIVNIAYQAPISYLADLTVTVIASGVTTTFAPGAFTAYGTGVTTGNFTVTINGTPLNTIVLTFNANTSFVANGTDQILVSGVRLDITTIATLPGTTSAFISNTTGQAAVLNPSLVVGTYSEPLAFATAVTAGGLTFKTDGTYTSNIITVTLNEVFSNAFETKGGANSTQISLSVGAPPTGMTLSALAVAGTGAVTATLGTTFVATTAASTYTINITAQNSNALEGVQIGFAYTATAGLSLTPPTISLQATLAPKPPATGAGSTYPYLGSLKFAARPVSSSLAVTVTPVKTNLIANYAQVLINPNPTLNPLWDTGITISNTSGNLPTTTTSGLAGVVKVTLYPSDASGAKTFTTSATNRPGLGLDANGQVPVTGTWVVLVSQLLTPAGITTDFRGIIRFQANFPAAEGLAYIADGNFSTIAMGYTLATDGPHF